MRGELKSRGLRRRPGRKSTSVRIAHKKLIMSPPFHVDGRFYWVCKGQVTVFVNGKKTELDDECAPEYSARTREVALVGGDVVVLRVRSPWVHRCLRMGFISTDGQQVLPVQIAHLRRLDDCELHKINSRTIKCSQLGAVEANPDEKRKRIWDELDLPLDDSKWLWGPRK